MATVGEEMQTIHEPTTRIRALSAYGCQVEVDCSVPIKRYFRSGLEMIRMANVYLDEGNLESAFILYSKFITLFIERLPKHPDYKTASPVEKQANKKKVQTVFPLAEEIKKKLLRRFEEEYAAWQKEEKKRLEELAKQEALRKAAEEREQEEQAKLEEAREQMRLEDEERFRQEQEAEYRYYQEQERLRLQREEEARVPGGIAAVAGGASVVPALPPDSIPPPPAYSQVFPPDSAHPSGISLPGAVATPFVPSRDMKPSPSAPPIGDLSLEPSAANSVPVIDRSTKPSIDHFTSTGGNTGNAYGLRDLFVPAELIVRFKNLAQSNSSRDVETLGLLCGKMARDAFRITHLVIPKQTGTHDSCDMLGEEEIYAVQDKYDLLTLGWIHVTTSSHGQRAIFQWDILSTSLKFKYKMLLLTHPTQTAFLSSVDMHQHWAYQKLMPEAVAIVCSLKFNETGFFFLTPNHGLSVIGNCPKRGFHEHHKDPPLFEECPHVKVDSTSPVQVVDLRK